MIHWINGIDELKLSSLTLENKVNTTLDPQDWSSARNIAHQMLDASLDYTQLIRNNPVWWLISAQIRTILGQDPLPEHSQSLSEMRRDIVTYVMPYTKGNAHPRYWGWVTNSGILGGVLPDVISATLNINTCSSTHCAAIIEWIQ